jgi:acyl transferase domain-containing protein
VTRPFRPMAIVSATCLLPGAGDVAGLWRSFAEGRTSIGPAPAGWMDRSIHYSDDPAAGGRTNCDVAALLDPWEFSRPPRLPPKQAATLDPAHRMALELGQRTVDALADTWLPREHTGVWIANAGGAFQTLRAAIAYEASARWAARAAGLRPDLRETIDEFNRGFRARYPHPREEAAINGNILSGRLTNYFDLRGPQRSVDAGGASSMAALRNACLSLEDGSCAMAFVGSVGTLQPEQLVMMSRSGMVAARRSFPFDKTACGYVPAEGGVMVALVRAEDAVAHGLPVLGVIRAIGASFDGPVPPSASGGGRRLAITRAWEEGEFDPDGADGRIDYIEAQGTGVRAGDAAEYSALLETYGKALPDGPLPFGSITSVVGYAAETAGLAGLLRALYVFDRGRLPPPSESPNPPPTCSTIPSGSGWSATTNRCLPDAASGAWRSTASVLTGSTSTRSSSRGRPPRRRRRPPGPAESRWRSSPCRRSCRTLRTWRRYGNTSAAAPP